MELLAGPQNNSELLDMGTTGKGWLEECTRESATGLVTGPAMALATHLVARLIIRLAASLAALLRTGFAAHIACGFSGMGCMKGCRS